MCMSAYLRNASFSYKILDKTFICCLIFEFGEVNKTTSMLVLYIQAFNFIFSPQLASIVFPIDRAMNYMFLFYFI